ncbi:MAG: YdcF family protein [Spirosoma sp.]|nr:YdcF family protein [Spirosoma sp.]
MFYFFSKTLNYLLTPAGWLMVVLLLAFFTEKTVRRRRLIGVGLAIFWFFGNSVLINELGLQWEYPIQEISSAQRVADSGVSIAVLLTGGMVNTSKEVSAGRFLLGHEADRAGQALYLYKTGVIQKILISGGPGDLPFQQKPVRDEGRMTARFLIVAGVHPADIVLESKSRNTHENALFSARMLHDRFHTNRCLLVTSASHMRRAVACFKKERVQVTPFPGNFMSSRRSFWSFEPGEYVLPHEQTFAESYGLVKEWVGYVVYWVVGYV